MVSKGGTKTYSIKLEISGPMAMWTRPDSGSAPVSGPIPSFSAAKGLFESILYQKSVCVIPSKVEICAPLHYHKYHTNYGGSLRKPSQRSSGASYQLIATVLTDVCYRLYADIIPSGRDSSGLNDPHIYKDRFEKRLNRGQWYRTPCLGWSEFTPSYLGPLRDETEVFPINTTLPSQLHSVFDKLSHGVVVPTFKRNFEISGGVALYAQ